ncbi:MAG: type IV secretion system DNA-binding domain-containing protein [bacterium]|nr:type IV secretion system DNA-binding domain-containing protein [bacterium]
MPALHLGDSTKARRPVFLDDRSRSMHVHLIGRTGTGKTSYMEHMIRQDIAAGRGVCVIDMLGNLYPRLVQFCAYYSRYGTGDRLRLFDPSDPHYCPALNYLEYDGEGDTGTIAEMVMAGIERVYKQQNDVRPLWETYAPLVFGPLIKKKLTLLEVPFFTDPSLGDFRQHVLADIMDPALRLGWSVFDSHKRYDDKFRLIMAVYNRGMRFWPNETMRRIVGQPTSSINWRTAMDDGQVVLCNLGQTGRLSSKMASLLGVILVHQITTAARNRRGTELQPFTVYIDEFGKIVCQDFTDALDLLRQFGVSFVLANQRLGQLKTDMENDDIYSSVMANTLTKISFSLAYDDAEIMAREIFALQIRGDDIKYQGKRTMLIPQQDIIELHGESSGSGSVAGVSITTDPNSGSFLMDSFQRSQSDSDSHASSNSNSTHEAIQTTFERELEDETPVFTSVEEKVNHYKNEIVRQPFRHCKVKLPYREPISLETPTVPLYPIAPEPLLAFKEEVYKRMRLRTQKEVDALIDDRLRHYLGPERYAQLYGPSSMEQLDELTEDKWQQL